MTLVVWLSVWGSACRCRVLLPVKKIKCTENNSVFFFMLDWVWYSSFHLHFCAAHVMDHVNTVRPFVGRVSLERSSACWVWGLDPRRRFVCLLVFYCIYSFIYISDCTAARGSLYSARLLSALDRFPVLRPVPLPWLNNPKVLQPMISPPPQHQNTLHCFIFSADGCITHAGRVAPNHHARAKTRDWESHWFRTTLLSRLNSSETHGFATDCTVKLFIIKNLFSAGSLRCRLWNGANIPSICLFSITTFWESKPADAPVVKNDRHSQLHPRQPSSLGESP